MSTLEAVKVMGGPPRARLRVLNLGELTILDLPFGGMNG
jgi:hypothetical protein